MKPQRDNFSLEKQKILIVDDRKANLVTLRQVLADVDAKIVEATSGNSALAATLDSEFALAILDVQMPGMDGYELAGLLRGDTRTMRLPIIFITASHPDEERVFKGYEAGAVDYILKPYNPAVLLSKVRVFLELHAKTTQLARRVEDLAASEERFRILVMTVPDIVYRIDPEGRFTFLNEAVCRLGYAPEDLLGRHFSYVMLPADTDKCSRGAVLPCFSGKQTGLESAPRLFDERRTGSRRTTGLEVRLIPRQGKLTIPAVVFRAAEECIVVEVSSSGLYAAGADPGQRVFVGTVGVIRDITERKRAEEELIKHQDHLEELVSERTAELRESEERFRALTDATAEITWTTDADGNVGADIPTWRAFTGQTPEQVNGLGWAEALHPDDRQRTLEIWQHAVESRSLYEAEYRIRRNDGEYRHFLARGVPIRNTDASVRQWVGYCADITRELELEAQLRQAQRLESVGRLAGGVAHDFNNLLSVILGNADFAIDKVRESDPIREDILEIRKAGERAAALTRQLLAFSRKQVLQPQVLDLNRVILDVEKMLGRLLGEDVGIFLHLTEGTGNVMADPGQIEQVIVNLCINARDAMPKGGKLTIETANAELDREYAEHHVGATPGPYVMLSVTDTGCGMDAGIRERIFEPFFTTKEKGKGTGLGLSTVYGIIKQSNGDIWVYSEPKHGTTFKVYLPRVDTLAVDLRTRPIAATATGTETVLIVEDDDMMRSLAERLLRKAGYNVLSAANGGEALLLCETHGTVDLLITDVVMPRMSGPELAGRLTGVVPGLRVLYMSGYTDDAILHHGVLDPGTRFIGKPFTTAELTRKVREVLDEGASG